MLQGSSGIWRMSRKKTSSLTKWTKVLKAKMKHMASKFLIPSRTKLREARNSSITRSRPSNSSLNSLASRLACLNTSSATGRTSQPTSRSVLRASRTILMTSAVLSTAQLLASISAMPRSYALSSCLLIARTTLTKSATALSTARRLWSISRNL